MGSIFSIALENKMLWNLSLLSILPIPCTSFVLNQSGAFLFLVLFFAHPSKIFNVCSLHAELIPHSSPEIPDLLWQGTWFLSCALQGCPLAEGHCYLEAASVWLSVCPDPESLSLSSPLGPWFVEGCILLTVASYLLCVALLCALCPQHCK